MKKFWICTYVERDIQTDVRACAIVTEGVRLPDEDDIRRAEGYNDTHRILIASYKGITEKQYQRFEKG